LPHQRERVWLVGKQIAPRARVLGQADCSGADLLVDSARWRIPFFGVRSLAELPHLGLSQLVLDEAGIGDAQAAQERLLELQPILVLETTKEAIELAKALLLAGALPTKAADDALHIAVAATKAVPFLLTWNCRHLANAVMRPVIETVCKAKGFTAPIICTPEELLETKL